MLKDICKTSGKVLLPLIFLMSMAFATYSLNFNEPYAYIIQDDGTETVWQQDQTDGMWYVCNYGQPEISNMIVSEEEWAIIRGSPPGPECDFDGLCEPSIGETADNCDWDCGDDDNEPVPDPLFTMSNIVLGIVILLILVVIIVWIKRRK